MTKWHARVVFRWSPDLGALGSITGKREAKGGLTAMDYIEIRQLVARSSYALGSVEDNGQAFESSRRTTLAKERGSKAARSGSVRERHQESGTVVGPRL